MKTSRFKKALCILFSTLLYHNLNAQVNTQDSLVLVDLYNSMGGKYWYVGGKNWLTKAPLSTWEGIKVSGDRVTGIIEPGGPLEGNLPGSLIKLTKLETLDLGGRYSSVWGTDDPIPSDIGMLVNLWILDLSGCNYTGEIPPSYANLTNLTSLNLSNNDLRGSIPAFLGKLSNLQTLDLHSNTFTSELPSELGSLHNLKYLDISNSYNIANITGSIPLSFGNLTTLQTLNLGGNDLSGEIPSEFGKLKSLRILNLSGNELSGGIPSTIGDLQYLQNLGLRGNKLIGNVPSSLFNLKYLVILDLGGNQLSGTIPTFIGNMSWIQRLFLDNNQFVGAIPSTIGNLNHLTVLDFTHNQLSGPFPSTLAKLGSLGYVFWGIKFGYNNLNFDGLENIVRSTPYLTYSPQVRLHIEQNNGTLSVNSGGTLSNNTYKWYRNGILDTTIVGNSSYKPDSLDQFFVEVSNSIIGLKLILYSDTVNLKLNVYTINPNPTLIKEDGSINQDLSTLILESNVTGAATDGITKVLLVAKSDSAITFTLNNIKDGKLSSFTNQNQFNNEITAEAINGKAAAIYTVPDGYGREYAPGGRVIKIKAKKANNDSSTISLNLVTPPVVLVHGLWSEPSVWEKKDGFTSYLYNNQLLTPFLVNYKEYNTQTFDPNSFESFPVLITIGAEIQRAKENYKNKKIAVSQTDVIGHSLGGLMARSFSQQPYFVNKGNFFKGDIHKLITLGVPHRGTPIGPELYNNRNTIIYFPEFGLCTVGFISKFFGRPIGNCLKDFGINSEGIQNLTKTLPFKTYSIQGEYDSGPALFAMTAFSLYVAHKSLATIFASRCDPNTVLPNDLIVPLYSQGGYINKTKLFLNVAHTFPAFNTETNNVEIQAKVNDLLLSADTTEFAQGFPSPSAEPLDCNTTIESTTINNSSNNTFNQIQYLKQNSEDYKYVRIDSTLRGAVYLQKSGAKITLLFDPKNGAVPVNSLFIVEGIGWFLPSNDLPDTVSFRLPPDAPLGKRNIALLVTDSSGISLGDTSHIIITANGILDSISADPNPIVLDSIKRESKLNVHGYFQESNILNDEDISDASTGTSYTINKGDTIFKVSSNGFVTAVKPGIDTLQIENNLKKIKVVVIVDSNFQYIKKYPNVINFPAIPDKLISDVPFELNATATSGEQVSYILLSGPIDLSNGIVKIKGIGTVTIRATSGGNVYFDTAAYVDRSFVITDVLPIELLNFSGSLKNNNVYLSWETAQEQNTSCFIIERSIDVIHFDSIGIVKAAGYAVNTTKYSYTDSALNKLNNQIFYYRLKEIDIDGKVNKGNVLVIKQLLEEKKIIVFPNPTKKEINLLFNKRLLSNSFMDIYDITGKLIFHQKLSQALHQQYILNNLQPGNYRIVIWENDKKIHQQSLLIRK